MQVVERQLLNNRPTIAAKAARLMLIQASAMALGGYAMLASAQTTEPAAPLAVSPVMTGVQAPKSLDSLQHELGRIWFTEDPVRLEPILNISAPDKVGVIEGKLSEKISFNVYSNYSAFLTKGEIRIYSPRDLDRSKPLTILPVKFDPYVNQVTVDWDGKIQDDAAYAYHDGESMQYELRVFDAQGNWDQTQSNAFELVTNVERTRALDQLKQETDLSAQLQSTQEGLSLEQYSLRTGIYGVNNTAIQNIVLMGGKVRLRGQDVPDGVQLAVNGQNVSIDTERKFVNEFLLPIGSHAFKIEAKKANGEKFDSEVMAQVKGEYWFMVGLADLTYSKNSYSGAVEAVRAEDLERFDGQTTDGRLAFYLKGKIKGKYLLTAHADTLEKEIDVLFKDFFKADRTDILRRIDPDVYYLFSPTIFRLGLEIKNSEFSV